MRERIDLFGVATVGFLMNSSVRQHAQCPGWNLNYICFSYSFTRKFHSGCKGMLDF